MSEIEFPTKRWPITNDLEMSVEHFEDIRKAIFRRWKGLGKWPFCYETYLDREMQYEDFNYFTYQYGGDGYYRHGIKGDNFSGHHYWQYYQWPGLTKEWIEGGREGDAPSATIKTPYRDTCPHEGTWVYLGLQQRWEAGASNDEQEWNNMPLWTPSWTFLPMQVKYWEDEDYQMRQQRQEINWWIAWYHWPNAWHSRPDPNDANGDEFCYQTGNKYNPTNHDKQYIDDSWQPAFHHYQAAIDNLATQITWADWFDAPTRNYWPDPDTPQAAYSDWKDVKDMVGLSWPTKSIYGYTFPTCAATDYNGYFLQNRLDYFLWLAEENGDIEVDSWLLSVQKTSDTTQWVIRPYWKMHNCDLDGEMSTHVLNDFKVILELMKYIAIGGEPTTVNAMVSLTYWAGDAWSKCKQLANVAVGDFLNYKNGYGYDGTDSGYSCMIVDAGGPQYKNGWLWSWPYPYPDTVSGAYVKLDNIYGQPKDDCSGWTTGDGKFAFLKFEIMTLTAGASPGDAEAANYDPFLYNSLAARHWHWRSFGSPMQCESWTCGVGPWGETSCKLIGKTVGGGLPYPTSGSRPCSDRDVENAIYRRYKADLNTVTAWDEYICFYTQPSTAAIPSGVESKWTCAGAALNMTSSALEYNFSKVNTEN